MSHPGPFESVLRFDVFELDVRASELRKRGVKLPLQGQPLQVLATLLKRAGDLVTREELRAEIWPSDTFVDFAHCLHNAVARLREALGDCAESPRYIETLPRRGYRFIQRVETRKSDDASLRRDHQHKLEAEAIHAIAVLPLEDLSGNSAQDYFAEGMTEALITSLAKIKALRVISRTSAMQYTKVRKSLPEIARELNVDVIIEGSVLRADERVRINVQLIQAISDQHLWAESYERDFCDILSLQSEIARRVAREIRIILSPEEQANLATVRQVSPEAHEWYLKARYHWNQRTEAGVKKALSNFSRAVDSDPTYAQGYVGIADSYNILGYYNALPPREAYPKAKAAALKALELDALLAEAHAALGVVKRDFEWDWIGADEEFRRAVELNSGCVEAYHWRATLLSMLNRHQEALREKAKALAIDPLSIVIRTDLGRMFYFSREYARAVEQYRSVLDMNPNFEYARIWLAHVYEQQEIFEEAIAELKIGVELSGHSTYALAKLGHGYAVAGRPDEARTVLSDLRTLSAQRYVSPYDIAMIYVGLQESDEAFRWFDKAVDERSLWLGYLNVEPQLDLLRSDARLRELMVRVGLAS